jgi:hypothetical protein
MSWEFLISGNYKYRINNIFKYEPYSFWEEALVIQELYCLYYLTCLEVCHYSLIYLHSHYYWQYIYRITKKDISIYWRCFGEQVGRFCIVISDITVKYFEYSREGILLCCMNIKWVLSIYIDHSRISEKTSWWIVIKNLKMLWKNWKHHRKK